MAEASTEARLAAWVPGWYNLDQSVVVNHHDKYAVCATLPDLAMWPRLKDSSPDVVFHNRLWPSDEIVWCWFRVLSIRHPQLGELAAIRTQRFGLYEFETIDGTTYVVEAEEGPGVCQDSSVLIRRWGVLVEVVEVEQ